jgi:hypothetical protein
LLLPLQAARQATASSTATDTAPIRKPRSLLRITGTRSLSSRRYAVVSGSAWRDRLTGRRQVTPCWGNVVNAGDRLRSRVLQAVSGGCRVTVQPDTPSGSDPFTLMTARDV